VAGEISWREVWYDNRTVAKLREEAGSHGCHALALPKERGEWAECIVFTDSDAN
jgi:hypothetical protein